MQINIYIKDLGAYRYRRKGKEKETFEMYFKINFNASKNSS